MQKIFSRYILGAVLFLSLLVFTGTGYAGTPDAENIDTTDKYAWSENTGWHNYNSSTSGVNVYSDHLEGYAWAENIGWVKMSAYTDGAAHTCANTAITDWGVNNDGSGNLSGYAWSENAGWVNFDSSHSQAIIDPATGDFSGYAWGENIGWISFSDTAPVAYKVKTSWVPDTTPPDCQSINVSGTPAADAASVDWVVTFDETANHITIDDFNLAKTGTVEGTLSAVSASSGTSVTVTVSGISGTGTLGVNLKAGMDIDDDQNNTPPDAFTGATHTVDRLPVNTWTDNFDGVDDQTWETVDTGESSNLAYNNRLELHTESTDNNPKHLTAYVDASDAIAIITARVQEITGNDTYSAYLVLRYSGSDNGNGYLFGITDTGFIYIAKRIDGVTTMLAEEAVSVNLGDMDCRLKFAVIGNKLFGKAWNQVESEPCEWFIETSDTTFASGEAGVGVSISSSGTSQAAFDDISVTTDFDGFYQSSATCNGAEILADGEATATVDGNGSSVTITSHDAQAHAVSISEVSGAPVNPDRGLFAGNLIDKYLQVNCSLLNGDFTAVVKLDYAGVDITGINEIDLRLYYYDEASESWPLAVDGNITGGTSFKGDVVPTSTLGDYGVDIANTIIWAVVNHFTDFGAGNTGAGGWVLQDTTVGADYLMLQNDSSQAADTVTIVAGSSEAWVSGAAATWDTNFSDPFGGEIKFLAPTTTNITVTLGSWTGGVFTASAITGTLASGSDTYDMDTLATFGPGPGSFLVAQNNYLAMRLSNSAGGAINETVLTGGLRSWLNATNSDNNPFPTLITLANFTVETTDTGVLLKWQTESEVDNTGFHIWRSTEEEGDYTRLTDVLIPATGSETVAAAYEYEDDTAEAGTRYYYKLEDIDARGVSVMHGPVTTATDHSGDDTCFINTLLGR